MDQLPKVYRPFHPKDPAHGMRNYDIGALNKRQIRKLNLRKSRDRNENEMYLKLHPEIKGLITVLLRYVLYKQPDIEEVHETIGEFFNRPRRQILVDLFDYFLHTEHSSDVENGLRALMDVQMNDIRISDFNR